MIYIVAWTTFVYVPIAHWNWGIGGWLKALGVIDFAGGLVVHTAAGVSAVAAALVIGRTRSDFGTSAGFLMAPRHALWSGFSPSGTSALGSICRVHPRTKSRPIAVAHTRFRIRRADVVDHHRPGRGGSVQLCRELEGSDDARRFPRCVRVSWGGRNLGDDRHGPVRVDLHQSGRP